MKEGQECYERLLRMRGKEVKNVMKGGKNVMKGGKNAMKGGKNVMKEGKMR